MCAARLSLSSNKCSFVPPQCSLDTEGDDRERTEWTLVPVTVIWQMLIGNFKLNERRDPTMPDLAADKWRSRVRQQARAVLCFSEALRHT
jgi:hypothetical protein